MAERRQQLGTWALVLVPATATAAIVFSSLGRASMWADEVATWSAASRSWTGLGRLLHHQDAVFALYYAAMHVWIAIAGVSPIALRLPSAIACVAAVAVTSRLTWRLTGSRWAAVTAGAWLAVNPFFVFYGDNARPYAFVALLSALTTDIACRSEPATRRQVASYAALATLGIYLHLFFGLLVVAHAVGLIAANRSQARRFLPAWVATAVLSVPLLLVAGAQRAQIGWIPPAKAAQYETWWFHLVGHGGLTALAFGLLAVVGATSHVLRRPAHAVLLAAAAFGSLALVTVSWWWPSYDSRYVIESTPAIGVLVAAGLLRATRWRPVRWPTARLAVAGTALATAAAMGVNAAATWTQQRQVFFYENLAAAASRLQAASAAGSGVIFLPAAARGSLYYFLDRDQDGDLRVSDLAAGPAASPVSAANFSGDNQPLDRTIAVASSYRRLVIVELGPPPTSEWTALTKALHGHFATTSESFGAMTLVFIRRN